MASKSYRVKLLNKPNNIKKFEHHFVLKHQRERERGEKKENFFKGKSSLP